MDLIDFIDNQGLFNRQFLYFGLPNAFKEAEARPVFEQIKQLYVGKNLALLSEAQLEEEVVKHVLHALGYEYAYQVSKQTFGKSHKPDFALFKDKASKDAHYTSDKASKEDILALCECKAYHIPLDNKKVDVQNPHFQLIQYLSYLKIDYGFLTNAQCWRFYDVNKATAHKTYFEINLGKIIAEDNFEVFQYFYYIFRKETLETLVMPLPTSDITDVPKKKDSLHTPTTLQLFQENTEYISHTVGDLQAFIYGENSVIEQLGQILFKQYGEKYSLKQIYNDSVFFAFRLLFIAYMEDKFAKDLMQTHFYYKRYALKTILQKLEVNPDYIPEGYDGWLDLCSLFTYLDKGKPEVRIPLFNGGLFAPDKSLLLEKPCLFDNETLKLILRTLLYHDGVAKLQTDIFRVWRDFSSLSIQHIGNIYESLLEFEFRKEYEGRYYVVYEKNKKVQESYVDVAGYKELEKSKVKFIQPPKEYKKNDVYLVNQSNTRKATASFYTPESVTDFMIKEGIEGALAQDKSILDLRLMDNACGSGHFLLACLKALTAYGLKCIFEGKDEKLATLIRTEADTIQESIKAYLPTAQVDEFAVLKRILLKKVLFGVDLNSFAIEITRLSLWLDTFIIGTPLSFIEHHIKQGNALIGATKKELLDSVKQEDLFQSELKGKIQEIVGKLQVLSDLKDTTEAEVAESKKIYKQVEPALRQMNLAMNFLTYQKFLKVMATKDKTALEKVGKMNGILESNKFEKEIFERQNKALVGEIEEIAEKYHFLNYEIEFAEVFQNGHSGFDLIIGNPPWDKTKFDDKDFFPFFQSNYRTLKQSEKDALRTKVFDYKGVKQEYEAKEEWVQYTNEYYKAHFPYNAGVGDNNLFRFFIERNLGMLNKAGNLTYVTPSAWIYEDSSTALRKHILEKYKLHFFYQIENKGVFPDVDSRYKFAIFKISNLPTDAPTAIPVRFMLQNTEALYLPTAHSEAIQYPVESIKRLSPDKWSLFEIKSRQDLELIERFYQKFAPLNPDYFDFRNELHMSADKSLFQEQPSDMILYEGKMIHQFSHTFAPPQYWVGKAEFEAYMQGVELSRLVGDIHPLLPPVTKSQGKLKDILHYFESVHGKVWTEADLLQRIVLDIRYPRLAFRGIAGNTNERTLIAGILPAEHTFGHSMFAHIPKKYVLANDDIVVEPISTERVLFMCGILNSVVLDYVVRFLVDINVVKSIVMRLPIPQPTEIELQSSSIYRKIIENTYKLSTVNSPASYLHLANGEEKIWDAQLPKTPKQKDNLQIENDGLIAGLYGVSKSELEHLTGADYFKILNEGAYIAMLLDSL